MSLFDSSVGREIRTTLPGEPGLPVVGTSLQLMTSPLHFALRFYQRHGPIGWIQSFGMTSVLALGPEANQAVFRDTEEVYSNAGGWEFFIGPFFERGLMLLDFAEHRFHRGVMQAAFKRPVLEGYFGRMQPMLRRALDEWPTGTKVRVAPRLKQLTLDLATEVFMGERLGPEADAVNRAFVDTVRAGSSLVRYPVPFGRWKRGLEGRRMLEDFFRRRIAAKRARPGEDLFSRLCEARDDAGGRFSDDDVVNHMIFLMMAAHDTSTITLCSILYRLARHRAWQDRVREEARAIGDRELRLDDLPKMPSLDLVMKEALRLITPVVSLARRTTREAELLGRRLPAGTMVIVSPGTTHHLPDWWSDPERFDPERFAEGRQEQRRHPFLFVPFGGDSHKCIGMHFGEMEIKAIVHHLLTRFRLEVSPIYEMPIDYTSLPYPADGLPIRFERLS